MSTMGSCGCKIGGPLGIGAVLGEGSRVIAGEAYVIGYCPMHAAAPELLEVLRELADRCDGEEGVRADGSNIQTMRARALLARIGGE